LAFIMRIYHDARSPECQLLNGISPVDITQQRQARDTCHYIK